MAVELLTTSARYPERERPPIIDGRHFPPMEMTTLLSREPSGRIRAREKMPLPVNEFGIPDLDTIIEHSLQTISRDYILPEHSNIHHLASLANQYRNHSTGSKIPVTYREGGSLLARAHVQLHNYWHEIYEDSIPPDMDVMIQATKEQTQINTLALIGNTALLLDRATYAGYSDESIRTHLKLAARMNAVQFKGIFYDFLDSYPDGQVGILPNREHIATLPFRDAVRELKNRTTPRGMDIRERIRGRLAEVGFRAV